MNRRKGFIFLFILLILVLLCVLFLWADQKVNEVQDQHREFIYCELISRGMPRDEVYDKLSLIGEFEDSYTENPEYLDLSGFILVT